MKKSAAERKAEREARAAAARKTEEARRIQERHAKMASFVNIEDVRFDEQSYAARHLLRQAEYAQEQVVREMRRVAENATIAAKQAAVGATAYYTNPADGTDATAAYARYMVYRETVPSVLYAGGYYSKQLAICAHHAAQAESAKRITVVLREGQGGGYELVIDNEPGALYTDVEDAWLALGASWEALSAQMEAAALEAFAAAAEQK